MTGPLSSSLLALLIYAAWTLALVVAIASLRTSLVSRGLKRVNSFTPSGDDVSPFSARLCRAHANCYENLPVFAAVICVAILAGRSHITDPLALWVVAARVAQSSIHLWSVRNRAVMLRFVFMLIQVIIIGAWIVQLLRSA